MFISVIVPAFNADRFLREAIESVLSQTHRDFELLLVNDGSMDGTLQIAHEYERQDSRVRVISHENWGMAGSLNDAVKNASAEWIARMDADDVMEPHRLERQVAFVARHPDLAVTASLVTHINVEGEIIGRSLPQFTTDEQVREAFARGEIVGFHHPAVLMRKSIVLQVGGYRGQFWPADDMDLWTRIAETGSRMLVQPEYLLRYRVHGSSASSQTQRYRDNLRWIEFSLAERRQGRSEPSREEYQKYKQGLPLLHRIDLQRSDLAWVCFRNSTLSFGSGDRARALLQFMVAAVLDPRHALPRVWRKFNPRRRLPAESLNSATLRE